ncbi:MAG: NAD(P)-binding domain-containing protein [Actinomycetota bacterium]
MTIGLLGVGHLAGSLLTGLLRAGIGPETIWLSPRGRGRSLAAEHGVELAADNTELVERSSLVVLAVRPNDAVNAVRGLPWRADHVVASACAGVGREQLIPEVGPARVVRIMPITAAEQGASPTLVHPLEPEVRATLQPFLDAIGTTIALDTEDQFEAATVSAAVYGWVQSLIKAGAEWGADNGLDPATARRLTARTFVAAGLMQADDTLPMETVLAGLRTPGGITEAGLEHLDRANVPHEWVGAHDLVLRRLRGEA